MEYAHYRNRETGISYVEPLGQHESAAPPETIERTIIMCECGRPFNAESVWDAHAARRHKDKPVKFESKSMTFTLDKSNVSV